MFLERSFLPNYDTEQLRLILCPQHSGHNTLLALRACSRLVVIRTCEAPESEDGSPESVEADRDTERLLTSDGVCHWDVQQPASINLLICKVRMNILL